MLGLKLNHVSKRSHCSRYFNGYIRRSEWVNNGEGTYFSPIRSHAHSFEIKWPLVSINHGVTQFNGATDMPHHVTLFIPCPTRYPRDPYVTWNVNKPTVYWSVCGKLHKYDVIYSKSWMLTISPKHIPPKWLNEMLLVLYYVIFIILCIYHNL